VNRHDRRAVPARSGQTGYTAADPASRLERHLARVYGPGSDVWDDRARLADVDKWTLALWGQLDAENVNADLGWLPLMAPQAALTVARLHGQLRAALLAAQCRRRWQSFTPRAGEREPGPLALNGPWRRPELERGPPAAAVAGGAMNGP
jgi:hypothetical protein